VDIFPHRLEGLSFATAGCETCTMRIGTSMNDERAIARDVASSSAIGAWMAVNVVRLLRIK
jgi:hypothetical protein